MFEPLSRTQPSPVQLITRRKVGRPNRDRAHLAHQPPTDPETHDREANIDNIEIITYTMGPGGRTSLTRYTPKGQLIDSYA